MRVSALVRNEWVKTTRSFAFWISLLAFTGVMAIQFGQQWWTARGSTRFAFAFPSAWSDITNETTIVTGVFLVIVLAMLVGGEYAWKTARQNVIDGLSKTEFFLGKILAWLGIMLLFGLVQILVGSAFAAAGTPAHVGPWVGAADLAQVGGAVLCLVGLTSLGFFFTIVTRNAAAGIGLFFLYLAFGENLIGLVFAHAGEAARIALRYLPIKLFDRALASWQWDPAVLAKVTEEAVKSGGNGPSPLPPLVLTACVLGWTGLAVGGAYLIFRARDL